MRAFVALMAFSIATPALAAPVSLVVVNTSQNTILSVNAFPERAEVNVGSYTVPIAPGQAGRIDLALQQCQPVEVLVTIEGRAGEFRPVVDLCTDPVLTVSE